MVLPIYATGSGWITFFQVLAAFKIVIGLVIIMGSISLENFLFGIYGGSILLGGLVLIGMVALIEGHFRNQDNAHVQRMKTMGEIRALRDNLNQEKNHALIRKVECSECGAVNDSSSGTR